MIKANNKYPIPKELSLPIYTTPYTLDKDLYLAKDSVINFLGTAPAYLYYFSLSYNNTTYKISDKFTYTESGTTLTYTASATEDHTIIYIEYMDNWYRVTYIAHRATSEMSITIPASSYYYSAAHAPYNEVQIPTLTFYEGDQSILHLSAPSTPTVDGNAQIVTSSLITQFVFTSN